MISLPAAVDEFLTACRADGLRPATIKYYVNMLQGLIAHFPDKTVDAITVNDLRSYVVFLKDRGEKQPRGKELAHESIRAHLRGVRRFWHWATAEYELPKNPMARIRIPARQKSEPKAISLPDLSAMLNACDGSFSGLRDRALISFLADTGARAGGVISLTTERLHLDTKQAILIEKGDRSRVVPFTQFTRDLLKSWLNVRPVLTDAVFCSIGDTGYGNALSSSGLAQLLRRCAKRAHVTGRINPHSFRHGFARQYLINGGDLATLSQLMGHGSVNVTVDYYARYDLPELAKQHERFSPIRSITEPNVRQT